MASFPRARRFGALSAPEYPLSAARGVTLSPYLTLTDQRGDAARRLRAAPKGEH